MRLTIGNNHDYKIPIAEVKRHSLLNISKGLDTNEELNRNLRNSNAFGLDFEHSEKPRLNELLLNINDHNIVADDCGIDRQTDRIKQNKNVELEYRPWEISEEDDTTVASVLQKYTYKNPF